MQFLWTSTKTKASVHGVMLLLLLRPILRTRWQVWNAFVTEVSSRSTFHILQHFQNINIYKKRESTCLKLENKSLLGRPTTGCPWGELTKCWAVRWNAIGPESVVGWIALFLLQSLSVASTSNVVCRLKETPNVVCVTAALSAFKCCSHFFLFGRVECQVVGDSHLCV